MCLTPAAKSPSFYNDIRRDGNRKTNFLMLPSRRRLREYKSYIHPTEDLNHDVINELLKNIDNFLQEDKYVFLLLDEMRIQEGLEWHKHADDLIMYVNLGNGVLSATALKKPDQVVSHISVF